MNWFKSHLNITWLLVLFLKFAGLPLSILLDTVMPSIIFWIFFIIVNIWILYQKKRSYAWIIIPIAVLILGNNRIEKKEIITK
jgi:hypothetical protein